ncbi:YdcF family protein [Herbivorax alkaliphila]
MKKLVDYAILLLGILGVLNFLVLMMVNPVFNFGVFIIFFIGVFLLIIALVRIKGRGHLLKIKNKIIRRVFILLMALFVISFVLVQGVIIFSAQADEGVEPDYMIILGAGLIGDFVPPTLQYRLDKGIEYLEENPDLKVVVTGGQGPGETVTEAYAMEKYLINNGIDKKRIIKEERATNTFENFKFSKEILDQVDGTGSYSVIIVTNGFHIFRSQMIAERNGFEAYRLPAKTNPSVLVNCYLREYFAVIKSFIFDR